MKLEEIYKALGEGKSIIFKPTGNRFKFINDKIYVFIVSGGIWQELDGFYITDGHDNFEIYEEPKWVDNIPKGGILCKVYNVDADSTDVAFIVRCLKSGKYPFISIDGNEYKNAIPYTLEEIEKHIAECVIGEM